MCLVDICGIHFSITAQHRHRGHAAVELILLQVSRGYFTHFTAMLHNLFESRAGHVTWSSCQRWPDQCIMLLRPVTKANIKTISRFGSI